MATSTRAERKAARAAKVAEQRARTAELQAEQEKAAQRRSLKNHLIILGTLCITMPLLALGILGVKDSVADHKASIITLITTNYNVQDAQNIRTTSFTGDDVVISTDSKIHTCRGLIKDDLIAKKPITCEDNMVIQPKM